MFHRVKSEALKESPFKTPASGAPAAAAQSQGAAAPQPQRQSGLPSASNANSFLTSGQGYASRPDSSNAAEQQKPSQPRQQSVQQPASQEKENVMSEQKNSSQDDQAEEKVVTKSPEIGSGLYAQPASQRTSSPYMGGSYPGYGAVSRHDERSRYADQGLERRLVIGQGITMSGEIESCDHLLVEGTIEAALKGAKILEVSETGTFYGTVEIGEATIAGRFEGDLTVDGRLVLKAGGVITGSIAYRELQVEAGAIIDGKLTPLRAAGDAAEKRPANSKAAKPAIPARKSENSTANADGLFADTAAAE